MTKKRKPNYFIPIAVITAIGLAIYTSSKPWKVYEQEKSKASDMRSEMDGLQRSNAKLREKDQMMSPVQKEEEARRLGYVLPNETIVPEKAQKVPAEKPEVMQETVKKPEVATPPIDLRDSDKNEEVSAAPQ